MRQRHFIESFVTHHPRELPDEWRVGLTVARTDAYEDTVLRPEALEMMRPVGARIGLRDEQLFRAPRDNLDVHHQARHDIVAYQICETVRFLQRVGETADMLGAVSRVCEGDDTVQYPVRG